MQSRDPNPKSFGNCDDKVRFKPFWCNKRPEAVIQPYQQRLDCKATQVRKGREGGSQCSCGGRERKRAC